MDEQECGFFLFANRKMIFFLVIMTIIRWTLWSCTAVVVANILNARAIITSSNYCSIIAGSWVAARWQHWKKKYVDIEITIFSHIRVFFLEMQDFFATSSAQWNSCLIIKNATLCVN